MLQEEIEETNEINIELIPRFKIIIKYLLLLLIYLCYY